MDKNYEILDNEHFIKQNLSYRTAHILQETENNVLFRVKWLKAKL